MTFDMWSSLHYFMIFFPFILAAFLFIVSKNKSKQTQQIVAIVLGVLMVGILLARSVYMIQNRGGLNPEAIPFQVCHLANFMMLFTAIFRRNKVIGAIAWCLNFPAGLVSLIFADSLTNYNNILNVQGIAYISGHMLIVVGGLYMLLVGIIKINKESFIKMYKIVGILYLLSIFVNNWFNKIFEKTNTDANYFYTFKPEKGTPLEMFYDLGENINISGFVFNPIYLLILLLFGSFIFLIFYLISIFVNRLTQNKELIIM